MGTVRVVRFKIPVVVGGKVVGTKTIVDHMYRKPDLPPASSIVGITSSLLQAARRSGDPQLIAKAEKLAAEAMQLKSIYDYSRHGEIDEHVIAIYKNKYAKLQAEAKKLAAEIEAKTGTKPQYIIIKSLSELQKRYSEIIHAPPAPTYALIAFRRFSQLPIPQLKQLSAQGVELATKLQKLENEAKRLVLLALRSSGEKQEQYIQQANNLLDEIASLKQTLKQLLDKASMAAKHGAANLPAPLRREIEKHPYMGAMYNPYKHVNSNEVIKIYAAARRSEEEKGLQLLSKGAENVAEAVYKRWMSVLNRPGIYSGEARSSIEKKYGSIAGMAKFYAKRAAAAAKKMAQIYYEAKKLLTKAPPNIRGEIINLMHTIEWYLSPDFPMPPDKMLPSVMAWWHRIEEVIHRG